MKPQGAQPWTPRWPGHRAACSRPYFSLQTYIFTDGEDEDLARRTGEPWTWGGWGGSRPEETLPSGEVTEATGLGGQFTQGFCSTLRPTTRPPPRPILMQMRPFQRPGPFELVWRQQVAGAGKKPPEWAGAGRGGAPRRGLGWGVRSPGLGPARGRG